MLDEAGTPVAAPGRWLDEPSRAEESVLGLARAPVLDVGCGPGRHVLALMRRGISAIGIDVAAPVVELAQRRGALVAHGSVFDALPREWGTVLLLDGNVGIGGDAPVLLRRVAELVAPGGRVLVEASPPRTPQRRRIVQLRLGGAVGARFLWSDVGVDHVVASAPDAGLRLRRCWLDENRWFVWLDRA